MIIIKFQEMGVVHEGIRGNVKRKKEMGVLSSSFFFFFFSKKKEKKEIYYCKIKSLVDLVIIIKEKEDKIRNNEDDSCRFGHYSVFLFPNFLPSKKQKH